jgi:hypothetical protein
VTTFRVTHTFAFEYDVNFKAGEYPDFSSYALEDAMVREQMLSPKELMEEGRNYEHETEVELLDDSDNQGGLDTKSPFTVEAVFMAADLEQVPGTDYAGPG